MFIAALFTIANIWKQPKCPSINQWIKNTYIYIQKDQKEKQNPKLFNSRFPRAGKKIIKKI